MKFATSLSWSLVLLLAVYHAPAATVRTLDGKVYEGEIRFDPLGFVLVTPKSGAAVKVDVTNLLRLTASAEQQEAPAGAILRDGSILAGKIVSADDTTIKLQRGQETISIVTSQVARLILGAASRENLAKIPASRSGALLAKGDFFEGEFQGIETGKVKISSILFGLSRFAAGTEAVAVALHDVDPAPAEFLVRSDDGTALRAAKLTFEKTGVSIHDPRLGSVIIAAGSLAEIRYVGARIVPLADFKPASILPAAPAGLARNATTAGVRPVLGTTTCQSCIGLSAGTAATYALNGEYKSLIGSAGVPAGILPTMRVRFIISADGVELFRSPDRTSLDDPLVLSVRLTGTKTLELRVEALGNTTLSASGLWGDVAIIKN
jgi:hypothetical protein